MLLPLALLLSAATLSTASSTLQDQDAGDKEVFPDVGEYLFSSLPMNWTEAYQFCNRVAGHMAVIDSQAEKEALTTMMSQHAATSIHLGFDDRSAEGKYYTITDEVVAASQWAAGYPRGGVAYNCGGFTAEGFVDMDCALKQNTICEFAATRAKPEGYELIPGHSYYKYHRGVSVTWPVARDTCRSEGAHLLILNSQDEQDQIYNKYPGHIPWLGVHRLNANNNDEFHTVKGEPLASTGFTTWAADQPSEDFLTKPYVYYLSGFVGMLTIQGNVSCHVICEIDDV